MTIQRCATDAPIALWIIDLTEAAPASGIATLSPGEMARAARFRAAADRRRYVAAHVGLRRLIADAMAVPPSRLHFTVDAAGKPRIRDCAELHFSLSYAIDRAVVGLSTAGPIGVDVETCRTIAEADELARLHFSATEIAALDRIPPAGRSRAFLRGWTRKEACVKAIGTGLALPTASFTCGIDHERRLMTIGGRQETRDVEVASVALPATEALLAWALIHDGRRPDSRPFDGQVMVFTDKHRL